MRNEQNSPKFANKIDVMKLSIEIDTISPIEAANGVAMLSGFILYLVVSRMTATSTKSDWTRGEFSLSKCLAIVCK